MYLVSIFLHSFIHIHNMFLLKELKEEANKWNSKLEEIMSKEAELQQRYKEMCNEEKHLNQRLTETSI